MSTPFTATLEARKLACDRGGRRLFEDLSFRLKPGDGLLVQGPNGTGKTSLMRQIAGLLPLSAGQISVGGVDADVPVPEFCHYVGHLNGVRDSLTVRENLAFWNRFLCGHSGLDAVEPALSAFGLTEIADVAAGFLSAGQKRKLALSRLFTCTRPIWLLDEPSVSLDTASVERLGEAIKTHGERGGIAIVSTHVPLAAPLSYTLDLHRRDSVGDRPHDAGKGIVA